MTVDRSPSGATSPLPWNEKTAPNRVRPRECGQGLPPAGGWKLSMREDPTEYSPEFQDEYRRLWHEAAAERDRYRAALERIYQQGRGPHVGIAREALDRG